MAKKKADTVDTAVEETETQAPTKSLFGGATAAVAPVEETETVTDENPAEDASEALEEAVAETDDTSEENGAAPTSDEDDVSVEELRRQQEEINRRLEAKTNAEKAGVIAQVVLVVSQYGITTEELVAALGGLKSKRKGVPAKAKYRDPATGAEWSGRGKEPLWIKGKERAQYAIPEVAAAA